MALWFGFCPAWSLLGAARCGVHPGVWFLAKAAGYSRPPCRYCMPGTLCLTLAPLVAGVGEVEMAAGSPVGGWGGS